MKKFLYLCGMMLITMNIMAQSTNWIGETTEEPIYCRDSVIKFYKYLRETIVWAEQDIVLDKGFELSAGTSFSARVISVPNPQSSQLYIQNLQTSNH